MTASIELRPASAPVWQSEWEQRQRELMAAQGFTPADVDERLEGIRRELSRAAELLVSQVYADGSLVGYVAATVNGSDAARYGVVVDVWIAPESRRRGFGRAALSEVEERLREQGADRALVTLDPEDPAQVALFRHGTVNSQRMVLTLGSREGLDLPDSLTWRPLTASEYPSWLAAEIEGFMQQNAESGTLSAEAARERSERDFDLLLPQGPDTPDHSITVMEDAGVPLAWLWLRHHHRQGHTFVFSVIVEPGQRGKGYGRAIMRLGEQLAAAAGDHVLGLNVFGHNTAAIRLYTSLGYSVTDQSRTIML